MHNMNLNAFDLNLLRVFDAVMRYRNVSKAADALYLSQPAASHALSRLRHALNDELFVKSPNGMKPTSRALDIAPAVSKALAELSQALAPATFNPSTSEATVRLATHDYFVALVMPKLAHYLGLHAPNMSITTRPMEGRAIELLDDQQIDVAISAFGDLPERIKKVTLIEDDYVCVMRGGHPLSHFDELTLQRYVESRHLLISPKGDARGFVDDMLMSLGLKRHVALVVNQFSPAPDIVSSSDLLVTLPRHIAKKYESKYDLAIVELPFESNVDYTKTHAIFNKKLGQSAPMTWFVNTLRELCEGLFLDNG
ncbi:LysR family transcriptional regulator [Tenacibaculum sp. KUL152]|nr:LysR family transcriptional regulator [Tenacibaculum sp. KUL152]